MKKSEPKIIINLQFEETELEEKVKIAIDKYVEDLVKKNVDDAVSRVVKKRLENLLSRPSWDYDSRINNMSFADYIKKETTPKIDEYIKDNISEILSKKIASMVKGEKQW